MFYQKGKLDEAEPYLLAANNLINTYLIALHVAQLFARQDNFEEALRGYTLAQFEYGWTGHADKQLEDYLTKNAGGKQELGRRVADLREKLRDGHLLQPAQGSFKWPAASEETKPTFVEVAVAADGTGAVTDAKILNGKGDFRDAALEDARHLHLPPIAWPGHALETVRTITFSYWPPSLKSSEKRVKVSWIMGLPAPGNVTVISPDGEHVFSVPPQMAGALFSSSVNSKLAEGLALQRERSLDGDVDKLRQSIQENPNCVPCHGELAEMLVQKGDRAGAIAEYKEVVRIMPGSADSHYMLGIQFEAEGATQANARYRYDPKSHTLRAASSPNPKTAHADYESALEQYRLAHQLAPDSLTYKQAYQRLAKKLNHP